MTSRKMFSDKPYPEKSDEITGTINVSKQDIHKIIQGQKEITSQLSEWEKQLDIFKASLSRIFKLYKNHDSKLDELEKWKERKDERNGFTGDMIKGLQGKDACFEDKINSIQIDVAEIKTIVTRDEKKKTESWSLKVKIGVGVLLIVCGAVIPPVMVYVWSYLRAIL